MLPRRQPSFAHTTTCTPDAPLKQYRYILLLGFILFFLSFINVIYVLTLPDVESDVHSHDIVVTKAPPRDNVLVQTYDRASAERAAQREATDADVAPISWLGADYEFANAHPTYANPIRTDFPTFEEYIGESGRLFRSSNALRPKLRVCFATFAVVGPIKNGGIATADTALAEELVAAGHAVSILYLWGTGTQNKKIGYWIEYYRKKQITLIPLKTSLPKLSSSSPSKYIRKAYQTYSWLRDHEADFDILHFHEWHGPGYYVSLAKHQGLAFQKTMLVTTIHCPALFYLAGNQGHLTSYNNFVSDYLERTQVMYSDLVISPSKFMLEWTQQKQWVLPTNTVVQQNILSGGIIEYLEILEDAEFDDEIPFDVSGQDSGETKAQEQEQHIHIINQNHHDNDDDNQDVAINVLGGGGQEDGRSQEAETSERDTKLRAEAPVKLERIELIFFGRIEALKGVYEFCDAVDIVAKNERAGTVPAFDVTFLGNANLGKKDVNEYLNKRAERGQWPGNLKILTDYIQPEAIAYMKSAEGRVAVLASKAENSPYTVLECLALQIPFIASRVGGLPELIFEGDRDKVLFDVNAKSLAKALRGVLQSGVPVVRGTKDPLDTKAEWVAFHEYAFARFQQSLPTPAPSSFAATVERKREKLPPLDKHVHTHYDNLFQDKDRPLLKPQVQTDSALALAFAAPITANGVSATTFPSISVCMPYHDRGTLLFQTIDAMMVQDYPGTFELVIADDGSTDPEALLTLEVIAAELFEKVTLVNTKPAEQQQAEAERRQALEGTPDLARMLASIRDEMDKRIGSTQRRKCKEVRLTILTQPNQYPGKARNEAVLRARYPYVLFLDDDDIPKTYWMSTLMRVSLNTDADVVTSMCDFFKGQEQPETSILRWLTVGGAADLGFFHNVYGAYSALVKRDSFFRIGGYTTEYGTTFEDYEFFATAVLKGFRLENVPHALLWYRQNAKSHLMTSTSQYRNRVRSLRPYLSAVPPMLRNSIVMGYSVGRSKGTTDV